MQCQVCKKKKATVRYTEVVDGKVVKMNLCESCAQEKGIAMKSSFSLSDLLAGLADIEVESTRKSMPRCSECGLSLAELRTKGRLGCGACYVVFKDVLRDLMESIHKSVRHVGKVPERSQKRYDHLATLRELEAKLRQAVEKEEYEEAAGLRDSIQELQQKMQGKEKSAVRKEKRRREENDLSGK